MIAKEEFFGRIEDYCLNNLSEVEKIEFEIELESNAELKEEFEFERNVLDAISEKDILDLRNKLTSVVNKRKENGKTKGAFEMLDGFENIEEISENLSADELVNYFDSLPKVHVAQHELTSNENIHHFYKEQNIAKAENEEEVSDVSDFEDIEGLDEAIMESDIMNLRDTLSHVSQSVAQSFSVEDIDDYINDNMNESEIESFEKEMLLNSALRNEVELHLEMEEALKETDVLDLRSQLSNIMETETSWKVSENNIEEYIDGLLDGNDLLEFEKEFAENYDLKSEVNLRTDINYAIGEKEIMALRNELGSARKQVASTEIKAILPQTGIKLLNYWKQSAAVILLLIGLTGILSLDFNSSDKIYQSYFEIAQMAPDRSIEAEAGYLSTAKQFYATGNWEKTIEICDQAINEGQNKYVFQFLKGSSLQNMGLYQQAITQFDKVIKQNDNLFIEESEWYRALANVKLGNKELARSELNAIIERRGYFENKAKAIRNRLKYSVK